MALYRYRDQICADRIMARNIINQTMHDTVHEKVRETVLTDGEAYAVIEIDACENLEHSLALAVDSVACRLHVTIVHCRQLLKRTSQGRVHVRLAD